ncbi:hypothetical protein T261_8352 [Streptomyces lydicus]|nr:hypothetical protein T261_8352 [Streptomyces lydicus]
MIDAIAWKFQTGSQGHLPEKYGNWRAVYNRLRMCADGGLIELAHFLTAANLQLAPGAEVIAR